MDATYKQMSQVSAGVYSPFEDLKTRHTSNPRRWLIFSVIGTLIFTNLLSVSWQYWPVSREVPPEDYARTAELSVVWERFQWNTAYSTTNHTKNEALWDEILTSHGVVAVDQEWAAQHNWPTSFNHPYDDSKYVYLLEAYHQLHCIRMIRKTFWEAVEGRPYTHHPDEHMEHCFDALRQAVQCHADSTPLYSFGRFAAGDDQMHKCRNWDELRQWATDHRACYRDSIEKIPLRDHFGHCGPDDDGLKAIAESPDP